MAGASPAMTQLIVEQFRSIDQAYSVTALSETSQSLPLNCMV